MSNDWTYRGLWQDLLAARAGFGVRIGASVACGLILPAAALAGLWLFV